MCWIMSKNNVLPKSTKIWSLLTNSHMCQKPLLLRVTNTARGAPSREKQPDSAPKLTVVDYRDPASKLCRYFLSQCTFFFSFLFFFFSQGIVEVAPFSRVDVVAYPTQRAGAIYERRRGERWEKGKRLLFERRLLLSCRRILVDW